MHCESLKIGTVKSGDMYTWIIIDPTAIVIRWSSGNR
jgi:hypothetical protein